MDYMTTDGTVVKLAPPHDFNSAQTIAQDLIPNINGILNSVHSVGGDGSYVYRDGSWQYQPQLNSFYFNSSAMNQQQQNKNEQRIPASQMHRLNGMPGPPGTPQQSMTPQMTSGTPNPFMRSFNTPTAGGNNNSQWSRIG